MKRSLSLLTAFLLMLVCAAVPARADSIFDDSKEIAQGMSYTFQISDKSAQRSYMVQTDAEGTLLVSVTSDVKFLDIRVFDAGGTELTAEKAKIKTGAHSYDSTYKVSDTTGAFNAVMSYQVKEGTYYIQCARPSWSPAEGKVKLAVKLPEKTGSSSNYMTVMLGQGDTLSLGAVVTGKIKNDVSITSSNENVAVVDEEGNVTAVSDGNAVITVQSGKNEFKIAVIVG